MTRTVSTKEYLELCHAQSEGKLRIHTVHVLKSGYKIDYSVVNETNYEQLADITNQAAF